MADVTSYHRREILALLKSVYLVSFILFIGSFIFGNFGLNHFMLEIESMLSKAGSVGELFCRKLQKCIKKKYVIDLKKGEVS